MLRKKNYFATAPRELIFAFVLFCSAALMLGCNSTELTDVWKDPSIQTPMLNKMLVIVIRQNQIRRRVWEDAFVSGLASHGVAATPSYQLFPSSIPDTGQVGGAMRNYGFDGIMVVHSLPPETSNFAVPGYVANEQALGYNPFKNRYFIYYQQVEHPGYVEALTTARREVDVYMTRNGGGQMIWSAISETPDPKSARDVQNQLVNLVVPRLVKQGIIPAKPVGEMKSEK
jgi:hypothetical protein